MRNISYIILVAAICFIGSQATAQSAEKKTILVNGQATEVLVQSNGTIESTVRDRPNYMNGYINAPANLRRESKTTNPVMVEVAQTTSSKKGDLVISFATDKVALDSGSAATLEDVVGRLSSAPKGFILLRSKFMASSSASNVIAQKRVYACKKYLESKGIAPNKILISLEPGEEKSDDVNIFIR